MNESPDKSREELQEIFGRLLGERFKPLEPPNKQRVGETSGSPLGSFAPVHVDEVRRLSEAAASYGVQVSAAGAGTHPEPANGPGNGVIVSFGYMQDFKLRDDGGVDAEPGALWLALDNELSQRGEGLSVYPTSAPRATIGGWLATDGLGIGSFEYGWLRENVLAAGVVLPGGELREIPGNEVPDFAEPTGSAGIVVSARLRTRRADGDRPLAVAFENETNLLRALYELAQNPASTPLWHVGFLTPEMARRRGLPPSHLLFGSYPGHRAGELGGVFWPAISSNSGESLGTAEALKVWGERFAPITPSRPAPKVEREFTRIREMLDPGAESGTPQADLRHAPVQGTLSRSGEVLLLTLETASGTARLA